MARQFSQSRYFQDHCIQLVSTALTRMAEANDDNPGEPSRFHSIYKPELSINAYIDRIVRYTSLSVEVFACAFLYILRFSRRTGMVISSYNLHRLLITSVTLSMKYLEDRVYPNQYMAKVGGISLAGLNGLEVAFLERMDYSLGVSSTTFEAFCFEMCQLEAAFAVNSVTMKLSNSPCSSMEGEECSPSSVQCSIPLDTKSSERRISQHSLARTV